MFNRMLGAARLSVDTFEDVERDSSATIQALLVVIIVSIASGVGQMLAGEADIVGALVLGVIRSIVSWVIWALVALLVGAVILKTQDTQADWGQIARGTGFAQTPGILNVLRFIPVVGWIIFVVASVWQFAAMVIAVRQSLDYTSTWRAFFVILIAFIPVVIINAILFWVLRV